MILMEPVHSDVCGPMSTVSYGGAKYFVNFIYNYSRICRVILCAQRMKCFQSLRSMERKSQIKVLHTDNGWEYTPKQFEDYLKMKELCTRKLYHILPNKMVSQRD